MGVPHNSASHSGPYCAKPSPGSRPATLSRRRGLTRPLASVLAVLCAVAGTLPLDFLVAGTLPDAEPATVSSFKLPPAQVGERL